jgi:heat shock protein HslJ
MVNLSTLASANERRVSDGQLVFMQFTEDGRVASKACCNRFTCGYTLSGSELRFAQMVAISMTSVEPLMEQKKRFLEALPKVARV